MKKLLGLIALSISLTSCAAVAVTGLAAVGYAAYDRHNLDTRVQDQQIIFNGYENIKNNADVVSMNARLYQNSHIVITSFHANVLVVGQVPTAGYKEIIATILKHTDGVAVVYNQLTVEPPTAKSVQTKDAFITASAKTALIGNEDVQSADIKVLTEDGIVYLMGYVSQAQARDATDVVRRVDGVKKIVTFFEYVPGV